MRPGVDIEYSSNTCVLLVYRDCLIKRTRYGFPGFQWYVLEGEVPGRVRFAKRTSGRGLTAYYTRDAGYWVRL